MNAQDLEKFQNVKNWNDFKALRAGQGHDWPDTEILSGNGINVIKSPTYEGLFKMLILKSFDYFPRSILEIWAEAESHQEEGLVVEPKIVIHIPQPVTSLSLTSSPA